MNHLVSIVVPIYNVEDYLEECLHSIITQTYSNIQIILVDDGSKDNSGKICDNYSETDERITVVHKENGGLSDARNRGLEIAQGKYIVFIDSDDVIDTRMIEKLYECIQKYQSNIAVCFYEKFTTHIPIYKEYEDKINNISGKQYIADVYRGKGERTAFVAWNKLYERELFEKNKISFPYGRIYEDTFTTYKLLYYAKQVSVIEEHLYYYRIRTGSITQKRINKKMCIDAIDSDSAVLHDFYVWGEMELLSLSFKSACSSVIKEYATVCRDCTLDEKSFCKKYIRNSYIRNWKKYSKYVQIPIYKRTLLKIFIFFPGIVSRLFNIKVRRR